MCAAACWYSTALQFAACLSICLPFLSVCLSVMFKGLNRRASPVQARHVVFAGAYTAKRYSLWQSRQAVLNAQLTGPTGGSSNQLDTETAAADAIAALGKHIVHQHPVSFCTSCRSFPAAPILFFIKLDMLDSEPSHLLLWLLCVLSHDAFWCRLSCPLPFQSD